MARGSILAVLGAAVLAGCANNCCTPYGYGYYYRPAYVAPVHAVPAPVYATPVYATPAYATPAWGGVPVLATPAPVATWWSTCCIY